MNILTTTDVHSFFADAVEEAMEARRVQVSGGVREYLVGLLVDFARRGDMDREALRRPVTLLLNEALVAPAPERFERLRTLGDSSLYVSGLFREHLEAHGVDVGYVSSVGATAYRSAAALLSGQGLFDELAGKFRLLVDALREVADALFAGRAEGPEGILRLYTRWQKTGSERLGRELIARGLLPQRGGGGVQ